MPEKLVLIDGHAILHRAFHALPPLTTRNGELVNAVYGFCTILFKVVEDLIPQYLIVAFDTPKPTFRHAEFVGYQAQRPKMDLELAGQIGKVQEVIRAFGIPIFEIPGYEADDIIGTLAGKASKNKKMEVIIVSGDRDLFQLVNNQIRLYMPLRGLSEAQLFGKKEVEEKMGVGPDKIIDYKSLVGDPSDNYPGVPGIGPKGAIALIKEYGTMEKVYQSLRKIKNESLQKKLAEGKESAEISKRLATVMVKVPLKFDLDQAKFTGFKTEAAGAILRELGFKSLLAKIGFETPKQEKREKSKDKNQPTLF